MTKPGLYVGPAYGEDLTPEERHARLRAAVEDESLPVPRHAREGAYLRTSEGRLVWLDADQPVLPVSWLEAKRVRDVARVLVRDHRRAAGLTSRDDVTHVISADLTDVDGEDFADLAGQHDEEMAPRGPVSLLAGPAVGLHVATLVPRSWDLDEQAVTALAAKHLGPLAGEVLVEMEQFSARHDHADITAWLRRRASPTVVELWRAGTGLAALLEAGPLDADGAWALLGAGRGDLLVGQPESDWLEAKSAAYRIEDFAQEIELGQDIARLANGEGGLIVCGYRTKKRPGGEELVALAPLPEQGAAAMAARTRKAIDRRVHPPVPGLRVERFEVAGRAGVVLAVLVPRTPDALRPFLVHGAVVAGRAEGAFFSIVMRRGEDSVTIGAAQVHALLAGRLAQDRPASERSSARGSENVVAGGPAAVPTHSPSRFHTPGPDQAIFVLRATARYRLPAGHRCRIDPAARRRLLTLLRADGQGAWEQPADGWQSTVNATLRRASRGLPTPGAEERVHVTLGTTEPSLDVVADLLCPLPAAGPLLPTQVLDVWTLLAGRCASVLSGGVATLTAGCARGRALELHLDAVGASSDALDEVLDLTGLGVTDHSQRASAAVAWPWAAVTPGAERLLALDALRTACLDWGSVDPDRGLRALGWTG